MARNPTNQDISPLNDSANANSQLDDLVRVLEPITRRVTLYRFLWGFTMVCAFVAWNRGLMLLYALVAFLLAVLLVSHVYSYFNLRGIRLVFDPELFDSEVFANKGFYGKTLGHGFHPNTFNNTPENLIAGEPVRITGMVESQNTKHFLDITLYFKKQFIDLRFNRPHHSLSSNTIESKAFEQAKVFLLRTQGHDVFTLTHVFLRRGVYALDHAKVRCAYPLGILENEKNFDIKKCVFYVLPHTFNVGYLPLAHAKTTSSGSLKSKERGQLDEFASIRPYRRGDAFKSIHWGASARQMSRDHRAATNWLVKEYDSFDKPRAIILLNQIDIRSTATFDTMLSIAASLGLYMSSNAFDVSIVGLNDNTATQRHIKTHANSTDNIKPQPTDTQAITPQTSTTQIDTWQIHLHAQSHSRSDELRKLAEVNWLYHVPRVFNHAALISQILSNQTNANVLVSFHQGINQLDVGYSIPNIPCVSGTELSHLAIHFDASFKTPKKKVLSSSHTAYIVSPLIELDVLASLFSLEPTGAVQTASTQQVSNDDR